jgi:hypothetical protein
MKPRWIGDLFLHVFAFVQRADLALRDPAFNELCPSSLKTGWIDRAPANPWESGTQDQAEVDHRNRNSMLQCEQACARDLVISASHQLHNLRNLVEYVLQKREAQKAGQQKHDSHPLPDHYEQYDELDFAGTSYPDRIATNLGCLGVAGCQFDHICLLGYPPIKLPRLPVYYGYARTPQCRSVPYFHHFLIRKC